MMNKNKSIQIVLMVVVLMGAFTLLQKKMGRSIVFGYGYDSTVISVNPLVTSNTSPQLSGAYTGGPYSRIYVSVNSIDDKTSYWGSDAVISGDGTWTLPAGTITTTIPVGVYNVIAMAFVDDGPDITRDATTEELKITADFSKINVSSEVNDQKARIEFENIENISQYMLSKHKNFDGGKWKAITDHATVSLNGEVGERTYYVKFRDITGIESDVHKESFNYVPNRYIRNSRNSLKMGDKLIQYGKKFSKNSTVSLYFSNSSGGFYVPVMIKTDSSGKFSVEYIVKKPAGKYKWYAVDTKTGKKTKNISYTIKK